MPFPRRKPTRVWLLSRAKSTANLTPRKPTVTENAIAVALKRYHTKKAAAKSLGITDRTLRNRTSKRK